MSLYRNINSWFSKHETCAILSHIIGGMGITTLILSLSPLDFALNSVLSIIASFGVGIFKEKVLDNNAEYKDVFTWGLGAVVGIMAHGIIW